jgi:hypothetical protein
MEVAEDMSLLNEAMTECVIINRQVVDDGYGGQKVIWTDGAKIKCAIVLNTSTQAQIAQKQGVTAFYTITTTKDIDLQYHEVIRRLSDGKVFRITSDGDDNKTPNSAGLNMRQTSAEEWEIPNE